MAIAITERRLIWQHFLCSENIRLNLLKKISEDRTKKAVSTIKKLSGK
jgi:hypothetical protein